MGRPRLDLIGQTFGRLTVLEYQGVDRAHNSKWLCLCECGETRVVLGCNLKKGDTKSCGCLNKEMASKFHRIHGEIHSKEYRTWRTMRGRCFNPNTAGYKNYGERGITVCVRWRNSFNNFLSDMRRCPKGLTIERIDNNGNYELGNCQWATAKQQARNRRDNRHINHGGRTKLLIEWAEELGINYSTLQSYIYRGHTMEEAFNHYRD